jgi:hypothetical protein
LKWNLLTINPVSDEGLDFKVRLRVGYRVITQFTSTGLVEKGVFFKGAWAALQKKSKGDY